MILLDSNTIIYLRDPSVAQTIVNQLHNQPLGTCNVIVTEVLGFGKLSKEESEYFRQFFETLKNYPFNHTVTNKAIELRKSHQIQIPDAIIAATAITNGLTLWTHNSSDFRDIPELRQFDPLANQ